MQIRINQLNTDNACECVLHMCVTLHLCMSLCCYVCNCVQTNRAVIVYSVLSELISRGGLIIALSSRTSHSLAPLLSFLHRHIINPRYASLLIDVANIVLDIYSEQISVCTEIDNCILNMQKNIEKEIHTQKEIMTLKGQLTMIENNLHHTTNDIQLDDEENDDSKHAHTKKRKSAKRGDDEDEDEDDDVVSNDADTSEEEQPIAPVKKVKHKT